MGLQFLCVQADVPVLGPSVVAEVKKTPLERRTPLRSKRPKGIPKDVRLALAERCLAQCELPDCTNLAQHPHHKLLHLKQVQNQALLRPRLT